jgi:aerobic-type carbon monoxide dehydrogenase small subunit (CoxS/CutS family)
MDFSAWEQGTRPNGPTDAAMRLTINGATHEVVAAPHDTLLGVLRGRLDIMGTKLACGRGECGACTVHLDGDPAYACLTLAAACEDTAITTIEGVSTGGAFHPLQAAFIAHDALQCGMCTSGQIMSALALLAREPDPSEEEVVRWMSGNLCRCGAYPKIARAVLAAARTLRERGAR